MEKENPKGVKMNKMYHKDFFEKNDISTVRNNYLASRTRIRYHYYLDKVCNPQQQHSDNIWESNGLMDESCGIDMMSVVMQSLGDVLLEDIRHTGHARETNIDEMEKFTLIMTALMEEKEQFEINDYFKKSEYLLNHKFDILELPTESWLCDNINYEELKKHINNYLFNVLSSKSIILKDYTNDSSIYIIPNDADKLELSEYFTIDVITLVYSLIMQEEYKKTSTLIDAILGNTEEENDLKENIRKKIEDFTDKGLSNVIQIDYANQEDEKECRIKKFRIAPQLDATFLYGLFNKNGIKLMESDVSDEYEIKKSFEYKIENINKLIEEYPEISYHLEQHFMMYSLFFLNQYNEHISNIIQTTFIASVLYDIPFSLARLKLAEIISISENNNKKIDNALNLIEWKYFLYSIAYQLYNKLNSELKNHHEKNDDDNNNKADKKEYLMSVILSGLFEDIENIFSAQFYKMEYSPFLSDICTALTYNQSGSKILHTFTQYEKTKKEVLKSRNFKKNT